MYLKLIDNDHPLANVREIRKPLDIVFGEVPEDEGHISAIQEKRNNLFRVGELGGAVLLPQLPQVFDTDKLGVVGLPKLDLKTAEAVRLPEIIALWDVKEEKVLRPSQQELDALNIRLLDFYVETGIRLRLRESSVQQEKGAMGGSELNKG